MEQRHEHLLGHLKDAHSMEVQAETMLKNQAQGLEDHPRFKEQIESHISETQSQRRRIEACINRLGGETSSAQDALGSTAAKIQGWMSGGQDDHVVKTGIQNYAFEQMEVATYDAIIALAELSQDRETAEICRDIRSEEEAMAEWLRNHLPELVRQYARSELVTVG